MTMKTLYEMWTKIAPQRGSSIGRRADPSHPLDFFIGYDIENNMQLMLVTVHLPDLPKSSQQIIVGGNKRNDNKYAICFSLVNSGLRDMFISLCWDIMDCTYQAKNQESGVTAAVKRFRMWQNLFAENKNKKMSDAEIRGLIGELSVMKEVCSPKYGMATAVTAWVGPVNSDRDFEFHDTWYEAKAVYLNRDTVSISSFDQLDTDILGYLVLCRLERTSNLSDCAASLRKIVHYIVEQLGDNDRAVTLFRNQLIFYGYDEADERIDESYVVNGFEIYEVADDFPRIRRSLIPVSISAGSFDISIAAIQRWRKDQKTYRRNQEGDYAEF